ITYAKEASSQPSSTSCATLSSRRSASASESSAAMTRASASARRCIVSSTAFFTSEFTKNAVIGPDNASATAIERKSVRFTPSVAIFWSMEGARRSAKCAVFRAVRCYRRGGGEASRPGRARPTPTRHHRLLHEEVLHLDLLLALRGQGRLGAELEGLLHAARLLGHGLAGLGVDLHLDDPLRRDELGLLAPVERRLHVVEPDRQRRVPAGADGRDLAHEPDEDVGGLLVHRALARPRDLGEPGGEPRLERHPRVLPLGVVLEHVAVAV